MALRAQLYLVAVALVLSAGGSTSIAYLCSMTGEVGPSCCCASGSSVAEPARTATIERASCCDVQRYDTQAPLATQRDHSYAGVDAAGSTTAAALIAALAPARCASGSVSEPRGPPRVFGPAVFVRNCSFLI